MTIRRLVAIAVVCAALTGACMDADAAIKRILLVGDSWTGFLWKDRIVRDTLAATGLGAFEEDGSVTAIGGTPAMLWVQPAMNDL
ncbi:MAG TPA: hypothetical protein PLI09_22920, partial [Candidatus Hydrogenedentes bacterium]|nr:hypothetical protein [Candidatus Hydrogenedentota bacterium]